MNNYAIIIIVMYAISLGGALMKHGEPREDKHDFWISLLSIAIMMFLMWKAGTFR